MKKSLFALGFMAVTFSSCKDNKVPSPVPATPPLENPVPTPEPKTVSPGTPVETSKEEKGTTISTGKDGIQVKTNNGETKTDINISKGNGTVEIKKPN